MNKSNDGFKIAEEDLRQRGPGDLFGVRQSGELNFRCGDIYHDSDLVKEAAMDADRILAEDPQLESSRFIILKNAINASNTGDLQMASL